MDHSKIDPFVCFLEFAEFFKGSLLNGIVTVDGASLENLPSDVLFVALELRVSDASTVLLLNRNDRPPPTTSFDKTLYEGSIDDGVVRHESISVIGYSGIGIEISGGWYKLRKHNT